MSLSLWVLHLTMALSIASLNVHGLKDKAKRGWIFDWVKQHQIDILVCQETHCNSLVEGKSWEKEWGGKAFWSFGFGHSSGVGIFIRNHLDLEDLSFYSHPSGRVVYIDFSLDKSKYRILNIYGPNNGNERKQFIKSLDRFLTGSRCHVLVGDFNFVPKLRLDKVGGDPLSGDIGNEEMNILCRDFSLIDVFRSKHPSVKDYTWFSSSKKIGCRLDRFYLESCFLENIVSIDQREESMSK